MLKRLLPALLLLGIAAPPVAQASLLGQTASCSMSISLWNCSPASATVVDPGVEFQILLSNTTPTFSVDVGPSGLVITNIDGNWGLGAGEVLTIGGLSGILGASLASTSGTTGITSSDVSFTSSSISLNMDDGAGWPSGSRVEIDITVVPEPGTLALLGLGLAGFAASRRRKQ